MFSGIDIKMDKDKRENEIYELREPAGVKVVVT
jgi:hypothetical protein